MIRAPLLLLFAAAAGAMAVVDAVGSSVESPGLRGHTAAEYAADTVVFGTFEGRTPCGRLVNAFTGFPLANCEKLKWEITLYVDSSGAPAGYRYRGTRTAHEGSWSIRRGAAHDTGAVVYQLQYAPTRVLSLLSIDDRVLMLLDSDLNVLVGDASWSYALNRSDSIR